MPEIKKPDYFRFLLIRTTAQGVCEILFTTDNEEEATTANVQALDSYSEEISAGLCRIDLYNIY